ncbi:hypothetical protein KIPB_015087, partial [Kipferlia bialata]|eukprot:g15087.t1
MVFFSSCASVQFHYDLVNFVGLTNVECLHGKMRQSDRLKTFKRYCSEESSGIMFSTDVAARGLDIPAVDWIVQVDPSENPNDYIHRVGRACRGE